MLAAFAALLIAGRFAANGSRAGDDATAVAVRAGSGPAAGTGSFFKRIADAWAATDRINKLEAENQQLREWRDTALALSERMERYEALLNMPADSFIGSSAGAVSARLILDPGATFKRSFLANAGADHGVREGFVAVNENGLVGRVVAVGKRSSRILMLDDFQSRVPVMGLQSRARGILVGDSSATADLTLGLLDPGAPRLSYQVPGAQALRLGETIVTSGDGGLYPRGLRVGAAERASDGTWRVKLSATSAPIDFVRLLPFVPIEDVVDEGPGTPTLAFTAPAGAAQAVAPSPAATTAADLATPGARSAARLPAVPEAEDSDIAPPAPDAGPPQ